jgi:hypothetical protein
MKIIAGLFFLLFFLPAAESQIIDNRLGNAFKEEMYFNREFLWQNKVKKITGTFSIKRPNRPIDPRPDLLVFEFNEIGLLTKIDKVTSVLSLVDSLTVLFKRNDLGEVEIRNEKSKKGFYSTKFIYEEGKVVRIDYEKSENLSEDAKKVEAGKSTLINSESFVYADAGTLASRKSSYNNYSLLYSNEIVTKNELGFIVSRKEELTMSGKTREAVYTYNDKGWVSKISYSDNAGGAPRTDEFYYDEIGNLLKVEYRENGELLKEIEVLYTETMLIEALINHDLKSHDIEIVKFQYEFY